MAYAAVLVLANSALAASSVIAVTPDDYTCSQPGYVDFEKFADKTDLSAETFPGIEFTTTNGFTWLVGDFATGLYNGKYPSGIYTSQGSHWAWLGEAQGSGRIDLTQGSASYFSLLVSANSRVVLDAFSDDGTLLETAGPVPITTGTGTMTELRITRPTADIGFVVIHDSGNFFLVDGICSDARGVGDKDTDGDGISDAWETNGVDTDGDGTIDLDLPAMGANPLHKDLFVEVDWLTKDPRKVGPFSVGGGFDARPSLAAANRLTSTFNDWPVPNSGGEPQGIHLHLDVGADSIMDPVTGAKWGSRSRANAIRNGLRPPWASWGQLDTFRQSNVEPSRRSVFHYVVFVDEIGCDATGCTTGQSRGIPGHDLVLAKGPNGVSTDLQEAVTLAHELGHNLGLGHGGRERTDDPSSQHVNEKANYLSIMNYWYSNRGLVTPSGVDGIIGYSPQELGTLFTSNLGEQVGFEPDPFAHLRADFRCSAAGGPLHGDGWGPIDWNCDGAIADGSSNAFLQDPDDVACVNFAPPDHTCLPADASRVLGSEDYTHLRFWGNGQGFDARNQALVDFAQPGTQEHTIAAAKADGVWWPNESLVAPSNPDVTVYRGSGRVVIPLITRNAGSAAFTISPRLTTAPTGTRLVRVQPIAFSPGAVRSVELSVSTTRLVAGAEMSAIVQYVDASQSVLGATRLTIHVAALAGSSVRACAEASRARAVAGIGPEQLPALVAVLPPKPTRRIVATLIGKAKRTGAARPTARLRAAASKRRALSYHVKLTRGCTVIATGTVHDKLLRVSVKPVRRSTGTGRHKRTVTKLPRLRGSYLLQPNGGVLKITPATIAFTQ